MNAQYKGKKVVLGFTNSIGSKILVKILKSQNMQIHAFSFKVLDHVREEHKAEGYSCTCYNEKELKESAAELNLDFKIIDAKDEFDAFVVDNYTASYINGKVSDPCFNCQAFKYRLLYKQALKFNADFITTGHFARTIAGSTDNNYSLISAKEESIDESYYLYSLNQKILSKLMLPLGGFLTKDIQRLMKEFDYDPELINTVNSEKKKLCFVDDDHSKFISNRVPRFFHNKGPVVNKNEYIVGLHEGIFQSRLGSNTGYVIKKKNMVDSEDVVIGYKPDESTIIVGSNSYLFRKHFTVRKINWILKPNFIKNYELLVQISDNRTKIPAKIFYSIDNTVEVKLEHSSQQIYPGSAIMFYKKQTLIGGGTIGAAIVKEKYV